MIDNLKTKAFEARHELNHENNEFVAKEEVFLAKQHSRISHVTTGRGLMVKVRDFIQQAHL